MKPVLITGANGYLGSRIAKMYALRHGRPVIAWLHAAQHEEFERKRVGLMRAVGPAAPFIRCAWGDLRDAEPFRCVDPDEVGAIVHSAAITRFNVERELACAVNVDGTEKLLEFAARCAGLEAVGVLSTVYASGLTAGNVDEAPLKEVDGFSNHYEWSKWRCEELLLSRFEFLPWRILRVATVVAEDEGGSVAAHNALHNTLKLLYYGLVSLVPGLPRTPLYFVTAEFTARCVLELMRHPEHRVIYNVAHAREESLTLEALIEHAWEVFLASPEFARRRVLRPVYTDLVSFNLLAKSVAGFSPGVVSQALSSIAPFARQLYVDKTVINRKLVSTLSVYRAPEPHALLRRTCADLVKTRWQVEPT